MNILVACEESQEVCKAFLAKGHNVYSCDIQMCSGGVPGRHIMHDVLDIIKRKHTFYGYGHLFFTCDNKLHFVKKWDMLIGFPPCTYLTNAGNQCLSEKVKSKLEIQQRLVLRDLAFKFVLSLANCYIDRICIENPVGYLNTHWCKPSQIIHPFYFCDSSSKDFQKKRTCLWLKNLPILYYLPFLDVPMPKYDSNGIARYFTDWNHGSITRSKTFSSVALAMVEQWGNL